MFDDAWAVPLNDENPDARVACVVLVDVSTSMKGAPITALQQGFSEFAAFVNEDPLVRKRVEVAVITFGSTAEVVVPLQEGRSVEPVAFTANGTTAMGAAINMALDIIAQRKQDYKDNGIQYYRPWLLVLTDGEPTDSEFEAAVQRLNDVEAQRGVTVFTVGVGPGANFTKLARLSNERPPVPLDGLKFHELFEWLSTSLSNVSNSYTYGRNDEEVATHADEQQVELPPLSGWAAV